MVRNTHNEFLTYNKIISQENFISDDETSFPVHTTVMHSSCNTVQCYTSQDTKQQKLSYKEQVQAVHVNRTPYITMYQF
jgi:hypothetical protein